MSNDFWRFKRVLIFGVSGIIGKELARELLHRGAQVIGVSRRVPQALPAIKHISLDLRSIACELHEEGKFDAIYHLAGPPATRRDVESHPAEILMGAVIDYNALRLVDLLRWSKFIYASSAAASSVLGKFGITDNQVHNPEGVFGHLKRATEIVITKLHAEYPSREFVAVRLFTVYGSTQDSSGVVAHFMGKLRVGEPLDVIGGHQIRTFVHISDTVKALLLAGEHPTKDSLIQAASDDVFSIGDVARAMVSIKRASPETLRFIDDPSNNAINQIPDASVPTVPKWVASVSLLSYLRRTLDVPSYHDLL